LFILPMNLTAQSQSLSPLLVNRRGQPITTISKWNRRRDSVRKQWINFLGRWPSHRAPLKTEVVSTEDLPYFTRHYIRYQIEDAVFTDGYLLIPKGLSGKRPGVVVFHQTVATHAKQPAGLDPANPELMIGVQLVERGYVVLCPRCFIFDDGSDYAGNVRKMEA